jgi:hypothetical protein
MGTLLALTLAGCAVGQPMAPHAQGGASFDTKLINFFSIGNQFAGQTNYMPNSQANSSNQGVGSNTSTFGAVAAAIGTGAAAGTNLTGQTMINTIPQIQTQNNLVL